MIKPEITTKYEKAKSLIATGLSIGKACREANLSTSVFHYRRDKEMGRTPQGVKVKVHRVAPKAPAAYKQPKAPVPGQDFVIVTTSANLANVLRSLS